jgi:DNA ligase-1
MCDEMNESNSNLDKAAVLRNYGDLVQLLTFIYSPYHTFGVSSAALKKNSSMIKEDLPPINLLQMLDKLSTRTASGHTAIYLVNTFITRNKRHEELIHNIIDKNLKTRMDSKSINKVFPDTIPEFSVALCNKYEDVKHRINIFDGSWLISRKLDGCRCLTVVGYDGSIQCMSRLGNEFSTLQTIKDSIQRIGVKGVVFDGEICKIDANGKDDFIGAVSEVKRKNFTMTSAKYMVFDYLTLEEFTSAKSERKLSERLASLRGIFDGMPVNMDILEQIPITEESFAKMADDVAKFGWEGSIARHDCGYVGKRSNDLLKIKTFFDGEYVVEDVEIGPIRHIVQGREFTSDMLAAVKIRHKGEVVSVGSGFSIKQRMDFKAEPNRILGKTITVKYFEESVDKDGKISLRFPTLKVVHGDAREV